ncbi:hypothetical protein J3R82DRAFT_3655 [Butyriboletus roseoflavus]|nr:hypothetical protein J3R82DRAFT_3655 [Butyriboletus roseoflavus]
MITIMLTPLQHCYNCTIHWIMTLPSRLAFQAMDRQQLKSANEGFVPVEIVWMLCAFLEFCYLVCQHIISEKALQEIEDALAQFHNH